MVACTPRGQEGKPKAKAHQDIGGRRLTPVRSGGPGAPGRGGDRQARQDDLLGVERGRSHSTAPRSSTIASDTRKRVKLAGTRFPRRTRAATQKAMSVAMGMPQPCAAPGGVDEVGR
jgi:hypothetical protein